MHTRPLISRGGKFTFLSTFLAGMLLSWSPSMALAEPAITGEPEIVKPELLDWPKDHEPQSPDLEEPTANRLYDFHTQVGDCEAYDMIFSTAGNYHMALRELWFDKFVPEAQIDNWFYTTSPPVSLEQSLNGTLTISNLRIDCMPFVAGGPGGLMNNLEAAEVTVGTRKPILSNFGNVLLVRKGNPKNIQSIWDLGKKGVRVVTSNPFTEAGSFGNYRSSIFNIADQDMNPPEGTDADELFNSIFNQEIPSWCSRFDDRIFKPKLCVKKWRSGERIHHREVPWAVATGNADVGPIFYHLALYAKRSFPDLFDIVPLGGTVDSPEPLPGNRVATMNVIRIDTPLTAEQEAARDNFIAQFDAPEWQTILAANGLRAPV